MSRTYKNVYDSDFVNHISLKYKYLIVVNGKKQRFLGSNSFFYIITSQVNKLFDVFISKINIKQEPQHSLFIDLFEPLFLSAQI